MRGFLFLCSLGLAAWSIITYFVGLADQATYFILLSIYCFLITKE